MNMNHASPKLKLLLKDNWLGYEPYVPKWLVPEQNMIELPPDELLPPHASCTKNSFNDQVKMSALAKRKRAIERQTLQSGIRFEE